MTGGVTWDIGLDASGFLELAREVQAAFNRHLLAVTARPVIRLPRTGLWMLGPWDPATRAVLDDMSDIEIHGGAITTGTDVPPELARASGGGVSRGDGMEADGAPFGTPLGAQPDAPRVPAGCQVNTVWTHDCADAESWARGGTEP